MKKLDGKLGVREYIAIIILTFGIKMADTTPALLFENGQQSTWFVVLLGGGVVAASFSFVLLLVKRHKDKGLVEVIYLALGKYLGFLLVVILFVITLLGTSLNSRSYIDIVSTMFFRTTPIYILYFMLMVTAYFVANRGLATIGRTASVILPYIQLALVLLIAFTWKDINMAHLFPLLGPGPDVLALKGLQYSSLFGELLILAIFFPFIRNYKSFKRGSWWGLLIGAVEVSTFLTLYVVVFSSPSVENIAFPFQNLTQIANIGESLQHTESIFLAFWAMAAVVHFSVYLYAAAALFAFGLRLKEPEPLLIPMAGLAFLLGMLPENMNQTIFLAREQFLTLTSIILIPLPPLLWLVDTVKGKLKHA